MVKTGDIPYGYVAFDGRAMTNYSVDAYNYMSNRIEAAQSAGLPVQEYLLNGRHNIMASHILAGEKS